MTQVFMVPVPRIPERPEDTEEARRNDRFIRSLGPTPEDIEASNRTIEINGRLAAECMRTKTELSCRLGKRCD